MDLPLAQQVLDALGPDLTATIVGPVGPAVDAAEADAATGRLTVLVHRLRAELPDRHTCLWVVGVLLAAAARMPQRERGRVHRLAGPLLGAALEQPTAVAPVVSPAP